MSGVTVPHGIPYPGLGDAAVFTADMQAIADQVNTLMLHGYVYGGTVTRTTTGAFTKATYPGLTAVKVRLQSAGGAGGGCDATSSNAACGVGGRSGYYGEKFILASALGTSETVTLGAAGTGASANDSTNGAAGSSFGSLLTLQGGQGGGRMTAGTSVLMSDNLGQAGAGSNTGYDLLYQSSNQGVAWRTSATTVMGGAGGDSKFGRGGAQFIAISAAATAGNSAGSTNYGAGGGGAANGGSSTAHAGGNGGPAICFIDLYFLGTP